MARYLEPVFPDDVAATSLATVWKGESELDRGEHHERLDLRVDGTFEHTISHQIGDSNHHSTSSCRGRWEVRKVRYMGADLSADGDREIRFLSDGMTPPLTDRLVVCGAAPNVNGFLGVACRLYPSTDEAESQGQNDQAPAIPANDSVSDAELAILSETTGQAKDRCLAALMSCSGSGVARLEAAAAKLLEDEEEEADAPGTAFPGAGSEAEAPGDAAEASKVAQLAACTGRSEEDCRAALRQYQEMDAAAEVLLTEEAGEEVSSPRRPPPPDLDPAPRTPKEAFTDANLTDIGREATALRRLVELTGQPLERCQEVLRQCAGPDEAAARLLGIEDAEVEPADAEPDADTQPDADAGREEPQLEQPHAEPSGGEESEPDSKRPRRSPEPAH
ncbi:unnamed protein product [Effrenium voratum]|uniref:Uncharacterized protein n=1 Tax=Effrenium voratum TaxID=2562239 RepID=A0AA36JL06_9DINO|nr:unnamed protein product [Effrenium voratum]